MPSKSQPISEELLDEPPTSINPYQVLDVEKDATPDNIKSAYRKAALQYHPGMNNIWRDRV
jgi:DnaJ family protein C protein 9